MPRVSRSVSQRYANAAKKKAKRRGEPAGHAAIQPPRLDQPPVEVPAGFGSPAPLEVGPERSAPARPLRASRFEARALSRGELRQAARRITSVPIVDYSYVAGDLRRIGVVSGVLLVAMIVLAFLPVFH